MKKKIKQQGFGMLLLFALVVFIALWAHMAIAACVIFVLTQLGVISIASSAIPEVVRLLFSVALVSVPLVVSVLKLVSRPRASF